MRIGIVAGAALDHFAALLRIGRREKAFTVAELADRLGVSIPTTCNLLRGHRAAAIGKDQKGPTHSSIFGVKLQEKMRATGVECPLMYPGATNLPQPNPVAFLIARLKTDSK